MVDFGIDVEYVYYIRFLYGPWVAVSRSDWIVYERIAGFVGPRYQPATHGFSGKGIDGRIEMRRVK